MNYSFGVDTLAKFWEATKKISTTYLADDLNEELAIQSAQHLWHLCDWYFEEKKSNLSYKQLSELQGEFGGECFSLRVMRDVANGYKHGTLDKTRNPVAVIWEPLVKGKAYYGSVQAPWPG